MMVPEPRRALTLTGGAGQPSRASRHQYPVGEEAGQQADEDAPHDELAEAEAAVDVQQLDDDVQDRTGRERQEGDRDRAVDPHAAEHRAEKRRPAADEAEQGKEAPARQRALAGDGRDDAEALRRIVQAEADDQDQCEADLPRGRRLADGEPLGEVLEADAERDEQREATASTTSPRGSPSASRR